MSNESRIARADAMRQGATQYRGQPCDQGHAPMRYTSNGACVQCAAERSRLAYAENKERKARAAQRKAASPNALTQARASRAEARNQSARTYQGQDCDHAHGGTRYTSNGTCVQCANAQRIAQGERIKADRKAKGLPTRNRSALGADILADL